MILRALRWRRHGVHSHGTTRSSRYGLYVDDGGGRQSQRLLELVTRRRVTVVRSVPSERGEVLWARVIDFGGMQFLLGNTGGWPPSHRESVTDMLLDRLAVSRWATAGASEAAAYAQFMKLAGPYWLSVLYARSDDDPVLPPEHYLTYRRGPVPDLAVPKPSRR